VFILPNCIFFPIKLRAPVGDDTGYLSTLAFKEMRALGFCTETGKRGSGTQPENACENSLKRK